MVKQSHSLRIAAAILAIITGFFAVFFFMVWTKSKWSDYQYCQQQPQLIWLAKVEKGLRSSAQKNDLLLEIYQQNNYPQIQQIFTGALEQFESISRNMNFGLSAANATAIMQIETNIESSPEEALSPITELCRQSADLEWTNFFSDWPGFHPPRLELNIEITAKKWSQEFEKTMAVFKASLNDLRTDEEILCKTFSKNSHYKKISSFYEAHRCQKCDVKERLHLEKLHTQAEAELMNNFSLFRKKWGNPRLLNIPCLSGQEIPKEEVAKSEKLNRDAQNEQH